MLPLIPQFILVYLAAINRKFCNLFEDDDDPDAIGMGSSRIKIEDLPEWMQREIQNGWRYHGDEGLRRTLESLMREVDKHYRKNSVDVPNFRRMPREPKYDGPWDQPDLPESVDSNIQSTSTYSAPGNSYSTSASTTIVEKVSIEPSLPPKTIPTAEEGKRKKSQGEEEEEKMREKLIQQTEERREKRGREENEQKKNTLQGKRFRLTPEQIEAKKAEEQIRKLAEEEEKKDKEKKKNKEDEERKRQNERGRRHHQPRQISAEEQQCRALLHDANKWASRHQRILEEKEKAEERAIEIRKRKIREMEEELRKADERRNRRREDKYRLRCNVYAIARMQHQAIISQEERPLIPPEGLGRGEAGVVSQCGPPPTGGGGPPTQPQNPQQPQSSSSVGAPNAPLVWPPPPPPHTICNFHHFWNGCTDQCRPIFVSELYQMRNFGFPIGIRDGQLSGFFHVLVADFMIRNNRFDQEELKKDPFQLIIESIVNWERDNKLKPASIWKMKSFYPLVQLMANHCSEMAHLVRMAQGSPLKIAADPRKMFMPKHCQNFLDALLDHFGNTISTIGKNMQNQ